MKKAFLVLLFLALCSNVYAAKKFNPFTSKPDYVGAESESDITINCASGKVLKSQGSGVWTCQDDDTAAGGSGGTVRVSNDGVHVTSADTINFTSGLTVTTSASGKAVVSTDFATTTTPGIASFDSNNFGVTAGGTVSIKDDGVTLGTETTGNYAGSASEGGAATTATALAANGANCAAGNAPLGVDASGAVESCTDYEEDLSNSAGLAAALSDETGTGLAVFGTGPTLSGLKLSDLTLGSIPYVTTSGLITQDNANLFWDDTNDRLCVGCTSPLSKFQAEIEDSATNSITSVLRYVHMSTGTVAAGFGAGIILDAEDEAGTRRSALRISGYWNAMNGTNSTSTIGFGVRAGGAITDVASLDNTGTFTTTTLSAPTLSLTGTGTINGLDAVDATGESTLESTLDIVGDVDGTGLGSVDLDEAAVETELESVLDLDALQGSVTDAQVPNNITVDSASAVENTDLGTLTDTKICTYDSANTEIDCTYTDQTSAGGGSINVSEDGVQVVSADTVDFTTGLKASSAVAGKAIVSADIATVTTPGIASFDTTNFTVGAFGGVSVKALGIQDDEIAAGAVDGGTGGEIADDSITNADINSSAAISVSKTALTAGRSLTLSTNDVAADAETYTDTKCYRTVDPTASTDDKSVWVNDTANGFTVTKLWCESDQTVNMMLQVDDGTAADMDSVDLACISTPDTDTSLDGDATIAAGDRVDVDIASVSGTPTWFSVCWTGTWDD